MLSSTAAEVPVTLSSHSRCESKKFYGSDGCGGVDGRMPSPAVVGPASTMMAAMVVVVSVRVSWNGSTRSNRVNSVRVPVKSQHSQRVSSQQIRFISGFTSVRSFNSMLGSTQSWFGSTQSTLRVDWSKLVNYSKRLDSMCLGSKVGFRFHFGVVRFKPFTVNVSRQHRSTEVIDGQQTINSQRSTAWSKPVNA
ncbi:hypothetical protein Hanom_Chr06g00550531 [Helianthus anomalus]